MADALRMHVQPTLDEPTLILAFDGWNDAGDSATGAARFIGEALHMVPLAEIDPEEYYDFTVRRPCVRVEDDGVRNVEWPAFEFRFGSLPGRLDAIIGVGGEPHLRWRSYCDQVMTLARDLGVKQVLLLGAYLADVLYSLPVQLTGFASPPGLLTAHGVEPTGYEGPTGIVGVLADRFRRAGIPVVSLWAGLPHYISATPNPRGSLALLQKAMEILGLPLDLSPVEQSAAEFETQISKLVASDPALSEYVKELKRRDFAQ